MADNGGHYGGNRIDRQAMPALSDAARAESLDALRGLSILAMALSGLVPMGPLPQWMYHAQLIAPGMKTDLSVPGLTWVDLVFPFFLFSMGAAIPMALSRRLEQGKSWPALLLMLARRFLLLGVFAIFVKHISPTVIANPPGRRAWLLALLGYVLLMPALVRLPATWSIRRAVLLRSIGWIGCVGLMVWLAVRPGDSLTALAARIVHTSDIIIVVLANAAGFGGLVWLLTRGHLAARLAVMIALIALRLGHAQPGWVRDVWNFSPIPWLYQFYYLQYLLIVLPGSIAGDALLRWRSVRTPETDGSPLAGWSHRRLAALAFVMILLVVGCLIGLQSRALNATAAGCAVLCAAGGFLVRGPRTAHESFLRSVFGWGAAWLLIGLTLEPYEGGIKKDRSTLSYYFVTSGLASLALVSLSLAVDRFRLRRGCDLLIATGQNPLMAYAGIRSLLNPLTGLLALDAWVARYSPSPWLGVAWATLKTLALATLVSISARRRIVWRI